MQPDLRSLPLSRVWRMLGFNAALSTAATVTPQGGAYAFPAAEVQATVVSSEAADTAAGTGARTVAIDYLDDDYVQKTVTATLNGAAAVTLSVDDLFRVNNFRVTSVGTGGVTAGNLTLAHGGLTYGYIAAGNNCHRQAVYTVPAGRRLFISGLFVSATHTANNKRTILGLRRIKDGVFNRIWEASLPDGFVDESLKYPLVLDEKTDFSFQGASDGTATTHVFAEGWLGDM